jgi:DNA-binding transcriptional MerR regulator
MRGIGEMARDCGLTVSALRFYDGAGVLVPAQVDPRSNYRWYSDEQVPTARLIARLRRVGMPLADISRVLAHRGERPVVEQVLQAHLTRLEDGLADARRELSAALSLLDQEIPMTTTRLTTRAPELLAALRSVRHAVGTDPGLPMLTGVLLDVDPTGLTVAATDRYRLTVSTASGLVAGPAVQVIAPAALVDEVVSALAGPGVDDVVVEVTAGTITVTVGDTSLRGSALDHEFPDHRRLLRTDPAHRVPVAAADLRARLAGAPVRTVRREQDGTDRPVAVLTLAPDGGLHVTGSGPDLVETGLVETGLVETGLVETGLVETGLVEMGLDREFLLQALDAAGSGQLVLELDGPLTPLAVRDARRPEHVTLLMPVALV